MTGIVLLLGISADPFELYTQSDRGLAFAAGDNDEDDDDDSKCYSDDDDDGTTHDDDNDGYHSDGDDMVDFGSKTYGGPGHDDDDDDDSMDDDDGDCVGGSGMSIEKAALLVSGAQMHASWMIPVLLAALVFGIVIARKI